MTTRSLPRRLRPLVRQLLLAGLLLIAPVARATAQPGDSFPRHITDAAGLGVTIPVRPPVVAVVGTDLAVTSIIAAADRRVIDPVHDDPGMVDWDAVGLLVIPTPYAAAYPAWITAAQSASVPVTQTAPVTSLADWHAAIRLIGYATGRDDRAAAVLRRSAWQAAAARLIARCAKNRDAVRVLILTPEGYTFGRGTLITDLIEAAGGINAAAAYEDFRQIDDSAIRDLAPDVILLSPAWTRADRAAFVSNPAYADIPAVQAGRVIRLSFSPTLPPDPGAALITLALRLHVM